MKPALLLRPAGPGVAAPAHAHRWRIEEARGPTSPGRCRDCGAFRIFRNFPPSYELTIFEENCGTGRAQPALVPGYDPVEAEAVLAWRS